MLIGHFVKCLFKLFACLKHWIVFLLNNKIFLKKYIMDISPLSDICMVNSFPHSVVCLLFFSTMSFEEHF